MILWFDGADYYTSVNPWPYSIIGNAPTIGSSYARTGINGLHISFGNNFGNGITPYASSGNWGMGGAARPDSFSGSSAATSLMGLYADGTEQVSLYMDNLGRLFCGRGVTPGSSGVTPSAYGVVNQFHYYELYATISSAGAISAQAYADGVLVQSSTLTGVASSGVNSYIFGNKQTSSQFAGPVYAMDDIYVIDGSGSAPWNAPLGDSFVVGEMPSASGSFAQWTPNPAGANLNWKRVNEIPADGITTYNQAAATGSRDSFIYPNFPPVGVTLPNIYQIMAVMELEYGETDSAGPASVQLIPRLSGVDDISQPAIALGVGFAYAASIFQKDPNGSLWLASTLNTPTEFGYKRIT